MGKWVDEVMGLVDAYADSHIANVLYGGPFGAARAKLRAALEARGEPVAHAWFYRGEVNFDPEDSLSALGDKNGSSIPLYASPQPPAEPAERVPMTERDAQLLFDAVRTQGRDKSALELIRAVERHHKIGIAGEKK